MQDKVCKLPSSFPALVNALTPATGILLAPSLWRIMSATISTTTRLRRSGGSEAADGRSSGEGREGDRPNYDTQHRNISELAVRGSRS